MNCPVLLLTSIVSALFTLLPIFVYAQPRYEDCRPIVCGNSTIRYPLGHCGPLFAVCQNNQTFSLFLNPNQFGWKVVGNIIDSSYSTGTLQITPYYFGADLVDLEGKYDWLMMGGFFHLSQEYQVGTIFNCKQHPLDREIVQQMSLQQVSCIKSSSPYCYFYPGTDKKFKSCIKLGIIVPANKSSNVSADNNIEVALQTGFQISWSIPQHCHSCQATGGRCLSSFYYNNFTDNEKNYGDYCSCPDGTYHFSNCSDGKEIDSTIIESNFNGDRQESPTAANSPRNPRRKMISTKLMAG